jgi:hypothetical protein
MRLLIGMLVSGLVAAQAPPAPLVFGPQAAWFRPADADGIARAVASYGGRPWLILGVRRSPPRGNGEYQWTAAAYAAPSTATPELRRGALVPVAAAPTTEPLADPESWSADPSSVIAWAQVALPGRTFDDVAGEQDENRPLTITGDITDADLLSAVRFLRSRPAIAVPPGLNLGTVPGPVRGIRAPAVRHPALPAVRVGLGLSASCGYEVVLDRRGATWTGAVEGGVGCGDAVSSNPDIAPQR